MSLNKNRITDIVSGFSDLEILVLGDVMLDIYDFGNTKNSKEINSEKKGSRAYRIQSSKKTLGGAGNVALNLLSLGGKTTLIGVTGDDPQYHALMKEVEDNNLNAFLVRDESRCTTIKNRIYIDDGQMIRIDHEDGHQIPPDVSEVLLEYFMENVSNVDAVILSDYGKGVFTKDNSKKMIDFCNEAGIPTIVDFKPKNAAFFRGATIMSPNFNEAKQLFPRFDINQDFEAYVDCIHNKLKSKKVVITLHDQGICGQDENKNLIHLPGNSVEEVDAVGCGDTVRCLLALGLSSGLSFEDTLALANDGAAIAVTKKGTSTISPKELCEFIQQKC
jgi:rfaE bifunctional protein kinase chain/domain